MTAATVVHGIPPEVRAAAGRGWRLFPVEARGKLPLIKGWPEAATSDIAQLEAWAHQYPACNWGLATGTTSGLVVIDVDGVEGRASLADLERQGLTLPVTLTVTTGRTDGGEHRYYRPPSGVDIRNDQSGKIGAHVDVRGTGGFVVCPPSIHASGKQYRFLDPSAPVADLPGWVIERLTVRPPMSSATAQASPQAVGKGSRTNTLVSLAGTMQRRGMTLEAIEAALLAENAAKYAPPLPEAKVRTIAADIVKRYPAGELNLPLPDEWPEPEPLAESLPDVMQFDLELMPESFRPLVKDVAERMQVPLDFPAVAAIATLAGITNRRAMIQPKRNDHTWTVVPNLWGGIVAPPGMLKSPVLTCMTQPARVIESEWRKAHEDEEQVYLSELESQKLEIAAWEQEYKKAAKKKDSKERPAKPESTLAQPTLRRLVTSDATFESLHHVLSENPAGLFVIRDELTGWLAGLERQGREQERAFFLECWNGDAAFTVDRIGRGSVHVPHACISLFGGIQPARLRDYLADAMRDGPSNDGLVQRFQLMVWPDIPPAWRYVDRQPDTNALECAGQVYRRMAALEAADSIRLQFDDEAQALFEQWLTDLEQRIRGEEIAPVMQAHLSKYRSLMPSLALLFALADGRTDCVPISQTRLACDWCEYLETHANRVYSAQARPEQHAAIALSKRLAKGWKREEGFFTVRDVYRSGWTALDSPDAARGALLVLEEYGWVRRETDAQTLGRPSETYRLSPRIEGTHAGK
jgi:putative DNA primase/helicase